jgi:hypothetical protein
MEAGAYNLSYAGGVGRRTIVQGQPQAKNTDPIWKIAKAKMAGHMAQVVQHLPGKYKALSSSPNTAKANN